MKTNLTISQVLAEYKRLLVVFFNNVKDASEPTDDVDTALKNASGYLTPDLFVTKNADGTYNTDERHPDEPSAHFPMTWGAFFEYEPVTFADLANWTEADILHAADCLMQHEIQWLKSEIDKAID